MQRFHFFSKLEANRAKCLSARSTSLTFAMSLSVILFAGLLFVGLSANAQGLHPEVITTTPYTGFNAANAIAVDTAGNIFIANGNTNSFLEQPANGGPQITLMSGLTFPIADAVDTLGNAYVGSYSGSVFKVPVGGGTAVDLLAGGNCPMTVQYYLGPLSISVDGANNVYVVGISGSGPPPSTSGQAVYMITPAGVCSVVVTSAMLNGASPTHVASDAAGNVSYSVGATLYTLPVGATTPVTVATFNAISGLRADKYGNVFVSDSATIDEIPFISGALNGVKKLTVLNSTSTQDIGIDTNGILYTTDATNLMETIVGNIWAVSSNGQLARLNEAGDAVTTGVGTSGATSTYGGVAFDATGNVWSVTSAANSLSFTSRLGTGATSFTGGGLSAPVSVRLDGQGYIWIANSTGNDVSVFNNSGVAQSGTSGYASASVAAPSALAIDGTGGVWVVSRSGNTVTHLLGSALPVVTPLAAAVAAGTLGVQP